MWSYRVLCSSVPPLGPVISETETFFLYAIELNRFLEGSHIVIITATDVNGNFDQQTIPFIVPTPLGK